MHTYGLSPDARWRAQPYIITMSLASAWLLAWGLNALLPSVPWWADVPSSVGMYGLWWSLYDRLLWRSRLARILGVAIDELGGEWEGVLTSSFDQFETQTPVRVRIVQTSSRMRMRLTTEKSESNTTGAILEADEAGVSLRYLFESRPRSDAPSTMHVHRGAAFLELTGNELAGDYFTGRDRATCGHLCVRRTTKSAKTVAQPTSA